MNISKALMPHEETEMLLHAFRKAYPDDRQTSALPGGSYVLKRMAELRSELRPPATAGSSANATKLTLDSDESKRVKARMESHPDFSNLKQLAAGSGLSGDDVIDIIADVLGKKR